MLIKHLQPVAPRCMFTSIWISSLAYDWLFCKSETLKRNLGKNDHCSMVLVGIVMAHYQNRNRNGNCSVKSSTEKPTPTQADQSHPRETESACIFIRGHLHATRLNSEMERLERLESPKRARSGESDEGECRVNTHVLKLL